MLKGFWEVNPFRILWKLPRNVVARSTASVLLTPCVAPWLPSPGLVPHTRATSGVTFAAADTRPPALGRDKCWPKHAKMGKYENECRSERSPVILQSSCHLQPVPYLIEIICYHITCPARCVCVCGRAPRRRQRTGVINRQLIVQRGNTTRASHWTLASLSPSPRVTNTG